MAKRRVLILFIIFDFMQEEDDFLRAEKLIRRRVIRHGKIANASVNKNCPKFIVGYCWYLFKEDIIAMAEEGQVESLMASFKKTQEWIDNGQRDRFNLANLIYLFGAGVDEDMHRRNFCNSRALYRFLSRRALDIMMQNKKIEKPLSYLICLEKLTSRLPNPRLVSKIQFK